MIKKGLLYTATSLVALLLLGAILIFANQQKIINEVINQANKKINIPITYKGNLKLSLLNQFPLVSLTANHVTVGNDSLAHIQQVDISFSPIKLLRKHIEIKQISLSNGKINMRNTSNGSNFNFGENQKEKQAKSTNQNAITLKQIKLNNISYNYTNTTNHTNIKIDIKQAKAKLNYQKNALNVSLQSNGFFKTFKTNYVTYIKQQSLATSINLTYKDNCLHLNENQLNLAGNQFVSEGEICLTSNTINLNFAANGHNIGNALALVPYKFVNRIPVKTSNGQYQIKTAITGKLNAPNINLNFKLTNGNAQLKAPYQNSNLTNINATGQVIANANSIAKLNLNQLSLTLNQSNITLNQVNSTLGKTPTFSFAGNGQITLTDLKPFIQSENLNLQNGKIKFNEFSFSGKINNNKLVASKYKGQINIDSVKAKLFDKSLLANGHLQGNSDNFSLFANQLFVKLNESSAQFTGGVVYDYALFIDSLPKQIFLTGNLTSKLINTADILFKTNQPTEKTSTTNYVLPTLSGALNVTINQFNYDKLTLNNIVSKWQFKGKNIHFKHYSLNALQGKITGIGSLNMLNNGFDLTLKPSIQNINLTTLFSTFNNFGQTNITAQNLNGNLSLNGQTSISIRNNQLLTPQFILETDLKITNGQLIKLKALEQLSNFFTLEQLQNISFNTLQTKLSIANENIYLPNTRIESNLLSLNFSGNHQFNHSIDYYIKLNLRNLLSAKFKSKKTMQNNYVNNKQGGINLFVHMYGNMENPEIVFDKNKVQQHIKPNEINQKPIFEKLFTSPNKNEVDSFFYDNENNNYLDW